MVESYYLDSSATLKRYLREPGSSWVLRITDFRLQNQILMSGLTPVEVIATLRRQGKQGGLILLDEAAQAMMDFRFDLTRQYQVLDLSPSVLEEAMTVADRHALRGADAVQLAAALEALRKALAAGLPQFTFVSADRRLNLAALSEGLTVVNPEDYP